MELHFTPELEADLARIALHEGKTKEEFLLTIALRTVEDELLHEGIVRERLARADQGIFVEQDEMNRRFQEMMRR